MSEFRNEVILTLYEYDERGFQLPCGAVAVQIDNRALWDRGGPVRALERIAEAIKREYGEQQDAVAKPQDAGEV